MLFSSLDADLDGASGFESERVAERLGKLDPGGGEIVGIVDGAPVAPGVVARLGGLGGVDAVHILPSGDGRATALIVELAGGLDDQEEDDAVEAVSGALRAIEAPEVLVGGELLLDDEVAELAERDAQRAEMLSLPVALV
jgi:RND superfamily putative drug exporter